MGKAQEKEGVVEEKMAAKPPMRWLWLVCPLLVMAASLRSADMTIGGGDTWVAMACGRYTLGDWERPDGVPHPVTQQENRTLQMKFLDLFGVHVTHVDPLSATSRPYHPEIEGQEGWINQNWLTHCIFYWMREHFGENSIVLYKFIQAILTGLFCYWGGRMLGAHPVLAAGAATFGLLLSRSYIDLRPNISSILFAAIMIFLIARWRSGKQLSVLGMIPVMLIWSNVHGGFIYAIVIFTMVLVCYGLQTLMKKWSIVLLLIGLIAAIGLIVKGLPAVSGDPPGQEDLRLAWHSLQAMGIFTIIACLVCGVVALIQVRTLPDEIVYRSSSKGLKYLAIGFGIVLLMPVIFSPFGLTNLIHPLEIAQGEEGAQWRQVIEWKPIFEFGFGQIVLYLYFLMVLTVLLAVRTILVFFAPVQVEIQKRVETRRIPQAWPKIDLALIAVLAFTVAMSIKSRRFVYLGGVVLAPLMAMFAQDIVNMIVLMRRRLSDSKGLPDLPRLSVAASAVLAGATLIGTIAVTAKHVRSMKRDYVEPTLSGRELSTFRRMVGIDDQPDLAMPFFDLNGLEGTVLNEWTNGGFVPFFQTPIPQTGEPPCKVYIDGRAQAAYTIGQFERQSLMRHKDPLGTLPSAEPFMKQLAQKLNVPARGDYYGAALEALQRQNPSRLQEIMRSSLYIGDRRVRAAMDELLYRQILRREGLREDDPRLAEKIIERNWGTFDQLIMLAGLSYSKPDIYGALLAKEGICVALMAYQKHSRYAFTLLSRAKGWRLVYLDDRYAILIHRNGRTNVDLYDKPLEQMQFPSERSKTLTVGYTKIKGRSSTASVKEGMEQLMTLPFPDEIAMNAVYEAGVAMRDYATLERYFRRVFEESAKPLEDGKREKVMQYVTCALPAGQLLQRVYRLQKKPEEAKAIRKRTAAIEAIFKQVQRRLRKG